MKIAVDFDDVLFPTGMNFIKYSEKKYDHKIDPAFFYDMKFFDTIESGWKEILRRILEYYETEEAKILKPIGESRDALEKIKKDHELIVMTGRPKSMIETTRKMTENNFPGIFSDFVATNVHRINGGKNKGEFCRDLEVDILIDDYFGFCRECAEVEIRSILFAQPWNENVKIMNDLISRANSWSEIPQIIKNY